MEIEDTQSEFPQSFFVFPPAMTVDIAVPYHPCGEIEFFIETALQDREQLDNSNWYGRATKDDFVEELVRTDPPTSFLAEIAGEECPRARLRDAFVRSVEPVLDILPFVTEASKPLMQIHHVTSITSLVNIKDWRYSVIVRIISMKIRENPPPPDSLLYPTIMYAPCYLGYTAEQVLISPGSFTNHPESWTPDADYGMPQLLYTPEALQDLHSRVCGVNQACLPPPLETETLLLPAEGRHLGRFLNSPRLGYAAKYDMIRTLKRVAHKQEVLLYRLTGLGRNGAHNVPIPVKQGLYCQAEFPPAPHDEERLLRLVQGPVRNVPSWL